MEKVVRWENLLALKITSSFSELCDSISFKQISVIEHRSLQSVEILANMLAVFGYLFIIFEVRSFELPACNRSEYLEPSLMSCQACPTNVSMVASIDGKYVKT